jgi:hypothetical protein
MFRSQSGGHSLMTAFRAMLIIAAMLAAGSPLYAQTAPPPPAGAPTMPGGMPGMQMDGERGGQIPMIGMMGMMGGQMMEMMASHAEGRLAFLKTELKITDAQSAQWNAFAEAVRANAKGMKDMHAAMMEQRTQSMTLPDRLGLHEKMLSAHLDALRRLSSAVGPLYAALTDEQKKTADEIMIPMGMM